MSTGDPVCSMCGLGGNGHADNCPRRFGPVLYTEQYPADTINKAQQAALYPNVQPHTTAYERDQKALRETVKSHDSVLAQLLPRIATLETFQGDAERCIANARNRIQGLEDRAFGRPSADQVAMQTNGDMFYTLESAATHLRLARECVDQCQSLGFKWACLLDELVVARWMVDNPDECRGAFDLQRLKKSIKL